MATLAEKKCKPCRGGVQPLQGDELKKRVAQLGPGWQIVDEHHLEKVFAFDDYCQALDFVYRVGEVAEEEGHHPDIYLTYGQARVTLWTHKINGLHDNDFILAAKVDQLQP